MAQFYRPQSSGNVGFSFANLSFDDIRGGIAPYLPPPQVDTYPVSAAIELITLRLGLNRTFVEHTVQLYLLERSPRGIEALPKFLRTSDVVPLAVHVYQNHVALLAPTPCIAHMPPPFVSPLGYNHHTCTPVSRMDGVLRFFTQKTPPTSPQRSNGKYASSTAQRDFVRLVHAVSIIIAWNLPCRPLRSKKQSAHVGVERSPTAVTILKDRPQMSRIAVLRLR
jgi:hypothetical protein